MVRIRPCTNMEFLRELHTLGLPADKWVGDDHTFWVAYSSGEPQGFVSAKCGKSRIFLSRVAVFSQHGTGLGRRLLRVAERYGKANGMTSAWTYVAIDNYPSINNLVKLGYSISQPADPSYLRKFLTFRRFL